MKGPKYSELDPRGGIRLGNDIPGSPNHIGQDAPNNPGGQAPPSQHIGEDAPSNPGGQAPTLPQHIGEDSPPPPDPALDSDFISSEDLATKGRNVERVQNDAIDQHKKDKTYDQNDPNTYLPTDRRYKVADNDPDSTPGELSGDSVNPILEHRDIGLDPHQPWTYREIISKGQTDPGKPTSIAMYSKEQKAIFAQSRYAEYDIDPTPDMMPGTPGWKKGDSIPPRLPSGEILWQQYKDVAGDAAGELRFIVIHPIANSNTNRVITEAHLAKGIPDDRKGTFTPADSNWEILLGDIWHQFLGTDNVKGIPFLTADHHNELGDKVVAKIHSWSPNRPGGISMGSLVVELGPR